MKSPIAIILTWLLLLLPKSAFGTEGLLGSHFSPGPEENSPGWFCAFRLMAEGSQRALSQGIDFQLEWNVLQRTPSQVRVFHRADPILVSMTHPQQGLQIPVRKKREGDDGLESIVRKYPDDIWNLINAGKIPLGLFGDYFGWLILHMNFSPASQPLQHVQFISYGHPLSIRTRIETQLPHSMVYGEGIDFEVPLVWSLKDSLELAGAHSHIVSLEGELKQAFKFSARNPDRTTVHSYLLEGIVREEDNGEFQARSSPLWTGPRFQKISGELFEKITLNVLLFSCNGNNRYARKLGMLLHALLSELSDMDFYSVEWKEYFDFHLWVYDRSTQTIQHPWNKRTLKRIYVVEVHSKQNHKTYSAGLTVTESLGG